MQREELIESIIVTFKANKLNFPLVDANGGIFQIKTHEDLSKTHVYDKLQLPLEYRDRLESTFIDTLNLFKFSDAELLEFKLRLS